MALRRSRRLDVRMNLGMATDSNNDMDTLAAVKVTNPVTPSPKAKRTRSTNVSPLSWNNGTIALVKKHKAPLATSKSTTSSTSKLKRNKSVQAMSSPPVLTSDMVAAMNPSQPFLDLNVPPSELRPSATLTTGQCFHWQVVQSSKVGEPHDNQSKVSAWGTHNATEFVGTVRLSETESVVVALQETPTTTLYRPLTQTNITALHRHLRQYFQLDTARLQPLYEEWSKACPRLATIAKCIPGVRIIDQDPWECLVSFICSSNNNIPRITKMLSALRREYGKPLLTIPHGANQSSAVFEFFSFPSLDDLREQATDTDLRNKCGLGYRAKYIIETMATLHAKGGEAYLRDTLRPLSDPLQVQSLLCEFCGVGPKVADCVALFSLRQENAIPVDTHVWNIALRDYDSHDAALFSIRSLTPTNYQKVGDVFRERFPNRAGWAHSLLFVAELPSFRQVLPLDMVREMDDFQQREKEKKIQKKLAKDSKKKEA
ncbi:DNA glycosylase [Nitzschia inconspicua]|uniref:DNA glycosylase n=1 Tax=Nitzschia inconspicua TaxID=303405 RepID=A0A9K3LQ02_9STRA|nr:DNA glycosylase [Nitzschia inconspicua]